MRRIPAIHACQSDVTIVCAVFFFGFFSVDLNVCHFIGHHAAAVLAILHSLRPCTLRVTGFCLILTGLDFFIYLLFSLSLLKVAFFYFLFCFVLLSAETYLFAARIYQRHFRTKSFLFVAGIC